VECGLSDDEDLRRRGGTLSRSMKRENFTMKELKREREGVKMFIGVGDLPGREVQGLTSLIGEGGNVSGWKRVHLEEWGAGGKKELTLYEKGAAKGASARRGRDV